MTALEALLAEVDALDKAATPGPWSRYSTRMCGDVGIKAPSTTNVLAETYERIRGDGSVCEPQEAAANAAFIARARTLLPLLREIVRVQSEALAEYGEHDRDCIRSRFEGGRPTEGGGYESKYAGRWYESKPMDRTPQCDCGRDVALARAEALAQGVRDA